jgi:hypothetical protein
MDKFKDTNNADQLLGSCEAPGCIGIARKVVEMGALNDPKVVRLCWECVERLNSRARQRGYPNYEANRRAAVIAYNRASEPKRPNSMAAKV